MSEAMYHLWVNEHELTLSTSGSRRLLDVLREDLKCLSVKEGCGRGDCGTCMVLIDGEPANACLVLIAQAEDTHIMTLEGLTQGTDLHPLQRWFIEKWAFQCGFCTPGMLLSSYALLTHNLQPTEEDIKNAIVGNLCRCTDYHRVIEAVQKAAEELRMANLGGNND